MASGSRQARVAISLLERELGDRRQAVVAHWIATEGERFRRRVTMMSPERAGYLVDYVLDQLLYGKSETVARMIESESMSFITGESLRWCKKALSENSRAEYRGGQIARHEQSADPTDHAFSSQPDESSSVFAIAASNDEVRKSRDAILSIEDERLRQAFLLKFLHDRSTNSLAKYLGVSVPTARKRLREAHDRFASSYESLFTPAGCERFASVLPTFAWKRGALGESEVLRIEAHLDHCGGCRAEVARRRRALSNARIFVPVPLVGVSGGLESALESVRAWIASLASRTTEFAAAIQSGVASHASAVQPRGVAVFAAAVIAAGGGGVAAHEVAKSDQQSSGAKTTTVSRPKPAKSPLTKPDNTRTNQKKKRRKKGAEPVTPPPEAPRPEPVVASPQSSSTDDGSAEFAPRP